MTFAFRAAEETGHDPADAVRAHEVVTRIFALNDRSSAVDALDGQVPAHVQAVMRQQHHRLLDRAVRWFLDTRPDGIDVPQEIDRFAQAARALAGHVPDMLLGHDLGYVQELAHRYTAAGVDSQEALRTASLLYLYPLLDVIEVAQDIGRSVDETAETWFVLSERYGSELLSAVSALGREDRWAALARAALRDELYAVLREFTTAVLRCTTPARGHDPRQNAASAVAAWEDSHAPAVHRARQTITDLQASGRSDVVALSVALRTLRTLLRRG